MQAVMVVMVVVWWCVVCAVRCQKMIILATASLSLSVCVRVCVCQANNYGLGLRSVEERKNGRPGGKQGNSESGQSRPVAAGGVARNEAPENKRRSRRGRPDLSTRETEQTRLGIARREQVNCFSNDAMSRRAWASVVGRFKTQIIVDVWLDNREKKNYWDWRSAW